MKKNQIYKGFKVLEIIPVEDCDSTGIWLKHERTGLEVFHLLNSDEENTFAFAFRTPVSDSTGIAHVLEHCVLCGSERYPVRDPFLRLSNQSVTTYLNAYTAQDRTVFPASSLIRSDYFNLMSVYGDAVFFPLLRPEIFMQECHRLELEGNTPKIQGVVFNEMKGNYSSFDCVAGDAVDRAALAGTEYAFDSGGDPLVIPSLTLSKLRAFHKKYYCPANCLLFLYGNIPTEDQLDFVEKNFLSRIKDAGRTARFPKENFDARIKRRVRDFGPADDGSSEKGDSSKNIASAVWKIGECAQKECVSELSMELMFLGELLWGDDCAPVAKALLDSNLGEDIAPQSGEGINTRYFTMCVGLRGIKTSDAKKMDSVIDKALSEICSNGIKKEDLERTCMGFDFSNREIRRFHGPYSLVILRRCLRGWCYGKTPWETLLFRSQFEKLRSKIISNPQYIPQLVKKYLLDNTRRSLVTVEPSSSWSNRRLREEKKLSKKMFAALGRKKVEQSLSKMKRFQSLAEDENIVPRVSVSDLCEFNDTIKIAKKTAGTIPFYESTEATNGIVYADVAFPADVLTPQEYTLIPLLASCVTEMGWKNMKWDAAQSLIQRITGGFGCYPRTSNVSACSAAAVQKNPLVVGRDWLIFHFKVLQEYTGEAFSLLSDCLLNTDFSDLDRLSDILRADFNNACSSLVPGAHYFSSMRSICTVNRSCAVHEIWEGVSSVFFLAEYKSMPLEKLSSLLKSTFSKIKKAGAVLHITADSKSMKNAKKYSLDFIQKMSLHAPVEKRISSEKEFFELTELPGKTVISSEKKEADEVILIPGTVGFASCAVRSSSFDTKNCMSDEVLSHLLETSELWNSIRTAGGAYGVYFSPNSDCSMTRFTTYRDPSPFDSLKVLDSCLEKLSDRTFTEDEVEKAVTGVYSGEIEPRTPAARGQTAFMWELYGLTNAQRKRRLSRLLSATVKDLRSAAKRYSQAPKAGKRVVFCAKEMISDKILKKCGKIIKLPL